MTVQSGDGAGAGGDGNDDEGAPAAPRAENLDALQEDINNRPEFNEPQDGSDKPDDDSEEEAADKDDPDKKDDEAAGDDDDPDDKKDDGKKDDDSEEEAADDEPPADDKKSDEEEAAAPTPPETDDDVTKPGKYKAEFVDEDGNKFYVSDVKQLPDDFEPQSNRNYGIALQELGDKRGEYKADVAKYEADKVTFDKTESVKNLRESWNGDIDKLSKDGIELDDGSSLKLPEDAAEREKAIKGTYSLMSAELKKGKTMDSFAYAYELYQAREARKAAAAGNEEEAERKKAEAAEKKKQGGKVMGGGAPDQSTPKGGVRKAPPVGTTLDMIHQAKAGSL